MNYILSQIEKQDGLSVGQEDEIISTLWNKRELAYKRLREYELQIEELQIHDNNNIVDGLKVKETCSYYFDLFFFICHGFVLPFSGGKLQNSIKLFRKRNEF